ncbi:MAG: MFS transporter, partial [Polyangiaceae bacterium]|nr:MFS transporter [Polyangiaceae bacterium]
ALFSCSASLILLGVISMALVRPPLRAPSGPRQRTIETLLAGIAYVRREKIILGAITLDLFAVFFGGITALLPIFAKDILKVGPAELGYFRSAAALGAGVAALYLARFPLRKNAGKILFYAVAMFGVMTLVFSLSNTLWLSMFALAAMGASDMVSVVVRSTVTQLAVPPEMRGRVGAVNSVFISASNELGEWESGMTAHWFGARKAASLGAMVTLGVVAISAIVFRELRSVDRFEDVRPRPLPEGPPET